MNIWLLLFGLAVRFFGLIADHRSAIPQWVYSLGRKALGATENRLRAAWFTETQIKFKLWEAREVLRP